MFVEDFKVGVYFYYKILEFEATITKNEYIYIEEEIKMKSVLFCGGNQNPYRLFVGRKSKWTYFYNNYIAI